jgi:hypothetical protein
VHLLSQRKGLEGLVAPRPRFFPTLLVSAEPRQSMTALEVKFSEAMSSRPDHWRVISLSMRSAISGSCSARGTLPGSVLGMSLMVGGWMDGIGGQEWAMAIAAATARSAELQK